MRAKLSQISMQIEISQSRQFKYSIVYVVKVAISYNCLHFVVKNAFISRHQMVQLVFWVPPIGTRIQYITMEILARMEEYVVHK